METKLTTQRLCVLAIVMAIAGFGFTFASESSGPIESGASLECGEHFSFHNVHCSFTWPTEDAANSLGEPVSFSDAEPFSFVTDAQNAPWCEGAEYMVYGCPFVTDVGERSMV